MKKVREKAKARTAAPAHLDALLLQPAPRQLLVLAGDADLAAAQAALFHNFGVGRRRHNAHGVQARVEYLPPGRGGGQCA